jgi:hypothetical protein
VIEVGDTVFVLQGKFKPNGFELIKFTVMALTLDPKLDPVIVRVEYCTGLALAGLTLEIDGAPVLLIVMALVTLTKLTVTLADPAPSVAPEPETHVIYSLDNV